MDTYRFKQHALIFTLALLVSLLSGCGGGGGGGGGDGSSSSPPPSHTVISGHA